MVENKNLEFKEEITNTFLKTVSAFSNYDGGSIIFGVTDDGSVKGIKDIKQACMSIENKINDSISPQPSYTIDVNNSLRTITLSVRSGSQKPYLYKSRAYKRNSTATVEVDTLEFSRLVLEGKNLDYEELPYRKQDLKFSILENKLIQNLNISNFNLDTLKTLELYSESSGFNIAAGILSDENDFPGLDIVRFGESINIINNRATYSGVSILKAYDEAINYFRNNYVYEVIDGAERRKVERVSEAAYREAIANAIIHRVWDVKSQIRVSMYNDRIEIVSPGGLPSSITKEEFLSGNISVLRNRILANVFYRLNYVEIFGTGIERIKQIYRDSAFEPSFEVSENYIKIVLPVLEQELNLSEDEEVVYRDLSGYRSKSISEITNDIGFSKSKTIRILNNLKKRKLVLVKGVGRSTKYYIEH